MFRRLSLLFSLTLLAANLCGSQYNEIIPLRTIDGDPIFINDRYLQCPRGLIEQLYFSLYSTTSYPAEAKVRLAQTMNDYAGTDEKAAAAKRAVVNATALKQFTGVNGGQEVRIHVCYSGGGMRAALSALGSMRGLREIGLYDCVSDEWAVSGSTWSLSAVNTKNVPFNAAYDNFIQRATEGVLNQSKGGQTRGWQAMMPTVTEFLMQSLVHGEIPSVMHLYGVMLGSLLDVPTKDLLTTTPAVQIPQVAEGQRALPHYTFIAPYKKTYLWGEFNPWESIIYDTCGAVPVWSLGRPFAAGVSTKNRPPMPQCMVMATCGSAISASFKEMYESMLDELQPQSIFASLKPLIEDTEIGNIRLFTTVVPNVTYKMDNLPYAKSRKFTYVDSGIDCCIPLPQKPADIIIVIDASGEVATAEGLQQMEHLAGRLGIPFPQVDYHNVTDTTMSVFDYGSDANTPIVIYFPLAKNDNYDPSFDPQQLMGIGSHLYTFSFSYTKDQAQQLAGLFTFGIKENAEKIRQLVKSVADRKTAKAAAVA